MKELVLFKGDMKVNLHTDGELVNITDLWKASGSDKQKTPAKWQESEPVQRFIKAASRMLNIGISDIIKSKKGKGGGTWAHSQIALEYTQYLDAELAVLVNQVFFERIEEEKNPDLIIDRAIKTYAKKGKTAEWISQRLEGKAQRNVFTTTLAKHGVEREGFKNCTNNIYTPLWGGGSNVVRMKKGLSKTDNIRDNLSGIELEAVRFAEALAAERISRFELTGNAKCEEASLKASISVRDALKVALH